ncbi:transcription-repair coupling factor [Perlabentimonas gracilis]|uniref:transcription-repair coupling factor n=1 Tax=Perlabentimonas gracilis TaxID=2715279 RepID=UPI001408A0B4|nr:transcription-repair coupling factor [Perlabentimonas gracilis]NHB69981.1 transcription-repair coupling factor [Perlabentimonas gracilis]
MRSEFPISELIQKYQKHPSVAKLASELNSEPKCRIRLKGLAGSSAAVAASALATESTSPYLFVLNDKEEAAYLFTDLSNLLPADRLYFFPSSYKRAVQFGQIQPDALIQRTDTQRVLPTLATGGQVNPIIISYPEALAEKLVTNDHFTKNTISLSVSEAISQEFLIEFLLDIGFERTEFVYEPGHFSVRGSIVDIFSFSSALPYRIDFFGDEVESIRSFDVDDQLSKEQHQTVTIIPNLQVNNNDAASRSMLTELLPQNTVIWVRDLEVIVGQMNQSFELAKDDNRFGSGANFFHQLNDFSLVEFGIKQLLSPNVTISFEISPQPAFQKNFELIAQHIIEHAEKGYQTYILAENPNQHKRLENIFENINTQVHFQPIASTLHQGFIDHDLKTCFLTDHQLFDKYQKYKLKNELAKRDSLSMKELLSLNPGDYVVHVDHGIGVFGGLVKSNVNGKVQEAVRLTYKDGDTLLVNIHNLHRISKYRGKDSELPKLYKLGSGAWQKLKQTTKRKVKDIAKELIALYAQRKAEKGFAYSPDSYLQEELEASFLFEDTPDQEKATLAVKEDMQSDIPMDRLVCGDVGFGKTEIAVRAAFKAVADSKQVAVLVPTTILALQHYQTFSQRLTNLPCKVQFISRMKSSKAQKEILKNLAEGKIDIIIGTHALLGSAIKFKDLGLIVVDEEQKFGVAAKEKLKKLRVNVDTLTLTATPIPRTLQFSLMGARDLSIINTPPPNRHPIATELHTFNTEILKEAIEYEVSRGGQVFFVHNRVQNIGEVQQMISKICSNVSSIVAHGQMDPKQLEKTMLDFISGDYDVLISTTIIESGLDIPNANTIIVNNAHMFGLSDLHQLRGRVGRSNKKAFCYLLAPPLEGLTPEARRRLKAIEEFSELGSGFSIAMQDLDIRGAGNMLGAEQSGFIADIGFETYHKILDEAMQELKEEEFSQLLTDDKPDSVEKAPAWQASKTDCHVETDMELLIPDWYVGSVPERMRLYKELDSIAQPSELEAFEHKLTDRFGQLPEQVTELLNVVRIRWIAQSLGMEKVLLKNKALVGYFISNQLSPFYRSPIFAGIIGYIQHNPKAFQMKEQREKLSIMAKGINSTNDALSMLNKLSDSFS